MAVRLAACCQAATLARLSALSPPPARQATSLIHRRGLASGGSDQHGPKKVNFWEDPLHPAKWKEEHFVIVSLAGWGLLFYRGYKFFTKEKNEKNEEKVQEASR